MKFKKLKIKNLRSYTEQEIEFPSGSLLLSGNVGSGKTTILLAIEYALFGLQAGQRGSALLKNDSDTGEVTLELEIDGNDIIIERKLKRDTRSITNDYSAITINGNKSECSTTELKSRILELIGYPSEFVKKNNLLYKYTVYTPQEQMKEIILEDPETRFSILRHVFGIDKYKTIRSNLTNILIKVKESTKEIQFEIKTLEDEKSVLLTSKNKIIDLEKSISEKSKLLQDKITARKSVEKEISELEKRIKDKEMLEKELEKANILLNTKQDSLQNAEKEEISIKVNISEFKEKFDEAKYISTIAEIERQKVFLEQLNSSYINLESSLKSIESNKIEATKKKDRIFSIEICPTCLQNVSSVHKHNIFNETENKLSDIKKQESSLKEQIKEILSKVNLTKDYFKKLEDEKNNMDITKSKSKYLEKATEKLEEILKFKKTISQDITLISKHMNSLKEQILKESPYDIVFKRKSLELKQAFVEEKNVEISRAESNKELELTHKEIERLKHSILLKEKSRSKLSMLNDLNDWLSNQFLSLVNHVERQVMMKLRREFSKLFSTWFTMIAPDSFEVQLDENFTPLIIQNGIEMDYSYLSGGERTAVALAYRLALNQTINSVFSTIKTRDIIILDEPTEGFSAVQIERIREIFEQLKVSQLILVSHEQIIEGFVDNIIKVKKDSGSSVVEQLGVKN